MTSAIICVLCVLLLIAYVFDLTAVRTRIPSVVLLLLLGWVVRLAADSAGLQIPSLHALLPILGTVGLILIVMEGSLELEFDQSKLTMIGKSTIMALIPMLVLAFGMSWALNHFAGVPCRLALINSIPLCVISSSIAIPSAKSLDRSSREFVVYESSISDILGVLFFNFVTLNESYGFSAIGNFGLKLILIVAVSFLATLGLALLLRKIDHPIKFTPIILMVILIYTVSKMYHLPALLFTLIFGLVLGNLDELRGIKWIRMLQPEKLNDQVHKFGHLTMEITFVIRSVFFILFGYLIDTSQLTDAGTFLWAASIVAGIFIMRAILLQALKLPLMPLLFIAPRGLITVLLFLSIIPELNIPMVRQSMITQVIILTALVMMTGAMLEKRKVEIRSE
jgi:hypothetical protein